MGSIIKFQLHVSTKTKGKVEIINNVDGATASLFLKPLKEIREKFKHLAIPTRCMFENLTDEQIEEMRALMPKQKIYF